MAVLCCFLSLVEKKTSLNERLCFSFARLDVVSAVITNKLGITQCRSEEMTVID